MANNKRVRDLSWANSNLINSEPLFQEYKSLLPEIDLENWQDPWVRARNLSLISKRSSLNAEIIKNRGGWLFPQKVYFLDPTYLTKAPEHDQELDEFHMLKLKACHSLHTRYKYVTEVLFPEQIEEQLKINGRVKIASFGSGTGIDVMVPLKNFDKRVTLDCYDLDQSAIQEGQRLSKIMGLDNRVKFHEEDIMKIENGKYDLGMLIGVICPLPDLISKKVIKTVREKISNNGKLIISASSDNMESGDNLGRWIIEYTGDWFLEYRSPERLKGLMKSCGMNHTSLTHEPLGYHRFAICS
jgi:hypothetical protein